MTMNQLARAIEMDQGLLSKIERGHRPPPQIVPCVERMAKAFGFENESAEHRQLVEMAYRERFGKAPTAASGLQRVAIGYYASLPAAPNTSQPRAVEQLPVIRNEPQVFPFPTSVEFAQAHAAFASLGIEVVRFEKEGYACSFDIRLPDGAEYELRIQRKRRKSVRKSRARAKKVTNDEGFSHHSR
jgi:transcriptional regulator with XRE-family HTH domain